MQNEFLKNVATQKIDGIPMEEFMSNAIKKLDDAEVDREIAQLKIRAFQQLNNRHKNVIDAQRVQLREYELTLIPMRDDLKN